MPVQPNAKNMHSTTITAGNARRRAGAAPKHAGCEAVSCDADFVRLRLTWEDGDADCADHADFRRSFGGLAATSFLIFYGRRFNQPFISEAKNNICHFHYFIFMP